MMEKESTPFKLTQSPLIPGEIELQLTDVHTGATVSFIGTVRSVNQGKKVIALEFEAYEPMVFKTLQQIQQEVHEKWADTRILLHHRLGRVMCGEIAVVAVACSAHRKEAFEACSYLMNRLKQIVPIWKKEIYEDGACWVSPTP